MGWIEAILPELKSPAWTIKSAFLLGLNLLKSLWVSLTIWSFIGF